MDIHTLLEQMKLNNKHIDQKTKQRELKFKESAKMFLSSINKELETMKRNESKQEERNEMLKKEIILMHRKYWNSSQKIQEAQRKVVEQRIALNNHIITVFPQQEPAIRQKLVDEKQLLLDKLEKLKYVTADADRIEVVKGQYGGAALNDLMERKKNLEKEFYLSRKINMTERDQGSSQMVDQIREMNEQQRQHKQQEEQIQQQQDDNRKLMMRSTKQQETNRFDHAQIDDPDLGMV